MILGKIVFRQLIEKYHERWIGGWGKGILIYFFKHAVSCPAKRYS